METLNGKTKIYQHWCECGRRFASPSPRSGQACPVCARELRLAGHYQDPGWVLEAWSQIQARDMAVKKPGRPRAAVLWTIVVDPDDSWGYHTRLELAEIKRLADLGYLAEGTVFERQYGGNQGKALVYRDGTLTRQLREEYERDRTNRGATLVVE